jgi:hypothetical protein
MKYIVGAGIGGLFGFSLPMVVDIQSTYVNDEAPRVEDSQPVDDILPVPIDNAMILPDNACRYINYDSDKLKEQAKECVNIEIPAIPAI